MKRLLVLLILLLTLLVGNPACSADFEKGSEAYSRRDYATASKEWKPLAEQGHTDAQYNLGRMYLLGQSELGQLGQPNYKTAIKWFTLAAEQGHADAQYNLGWMYYDGEGVPKNDETAIKWLTLAAEQGHVSAQYYLKEIGQGEITQSEQLREKREKQRENYTLGINLGILCLI